MPSKAPNLITDYKSVQPSFFQVQRVQWPIFQKVRVSHNTAPFLTCSWDCLVASLKPYCNCHPDQTPPPPLLSTQDNIRPGRLVHYATRCQPQFTLCTILVYTGLSLPTGCTYLPQAKDPLFSLYAESLARWLQALPLTSSKLCHF